MKVLLLIINIHQINSDEEENVENASIEGGEDDVPNDNCDGNDDEKMETEASIDPKIRKEINLFAEDEVDSEEDEDEDDHLIGDFDSDEDDDDEEDEDVTS